MKERVKALSLRAAQNCETAKHPECKCRCGGAAHGRGRVADVRTLPLDDPHSPSRKCERCGGTGKAPAWMGEGFTCARCDGKGRYLTAAVQKAALK